MTHDSDEDVATAAVEEHATEDIKSSSSRRRSAATSKSMAEDDMDDDDEDFKPNKKAANKRRSAASSRSSAGTAGKQRKGEAGAPAVERCSTCKIPVNHPGLVFYESHPDGSVEEMLALTDPSLSITVDEAKEKDDEPEPIEDDEGNVIESGRKAAAGFFDDKPSYRLTGYTFYDREGHVVAFDTQGIIQRGGEIYFSGYLKPVTDDSSLIEGGVAVCEAGPIVQWWSTGFGQGEKETIGVSTDMADYYLTGNPSKLYEPFMEDARCKVFIAKTVVDYLQEARVRMENVEYEDILTHIETTSSAVGHPVNEDLVVKHADYLLSQVCSYEEAGDDDEESFMMDSPAIQALINMAGLKRKKIKRVPVQRAPKGPAKPKKTEFVKATTTALVRYVFESFFRGQIDEKAPKFASRKKRCNACEGCLAPDCGKCHSCKDMPKFGGTGKGKQACGERKCANVDYSGDAVASCSSEEEDDDKENKRSKANAIRKKSALPKSVPKKNVGKAKVAWKGEAVKVGGRKYYPSAVVDGVTYSSGDFALITCDDGGTYVRRVEYLFEEKGVQQAHVHWFMRGNETVLGEDSEDRELFQLSYCDNSKLCNVVQRLEVSFWPIPSDWKSLGGTERSAEEEPPVDFENDHSFYYRMAYSGDEHARFEHGFDVTAKVKRDESKPAACSVCPLKDAKNEAAALKAFDPVDSESDERGRFHFKSLRAAGAVFKLGEAAFLAPPPAKPREAPPPPNLSKIDEDKYPEMYRKKNKIKGSNEGTSKPFQIGVLEGISASDKDGKMAVKLSIRKLYRPEDTNMSAKEVFATDNNLLFWSDDVITTEALRVEGKCFVRPEVGLEDSVEKWTAAGQFRFYFNRAYDRKARAFEELPPQAEKYGRAASSKGKGKSSASTSSKSDSKPLDDGLLPSLPEGGRPLRTLDVFAGCGGLSLGLHQSGVAKSEWAIEFFEKAAKAFKENNPDCTVFTDDCNELLRLAMDGAEFNSKKQRLPAKGEVELLCGGPPCQGFSGMNRFNSREYSAFRNSLCATYLSYLDYYRPRYFILENVRNFTTFKNCAVLKLCLRALIKTGYSCTFGVLQAGHYGVAQTRRRAILLAAAPGEKLPLYPEPWTVFTKTPLSVKVNDTLYESNCRWKESAPYRTVTVRDAISDLTPIRSGQQDLAMAYEEEPISQFQRQMRRGVTELRDHICKEMSALVDARIERIPTEPGSDWRDLPNAAVKLRDGTYSDKLVYNYHDVNEGKAKNGSLRGVCLCATGKADCDPNDKQANTLIPWCLPHTSARHNQWSGLYGRLEYDGYFSTTVTNPEPMGKQGRVLHPDQDRVVSVRECARSQGFPDWYKFHGVILDKHRQVGNAVAPQMGLALGLEIRKAVASAAASTEVKAEEEEKVSVKEEQETEIVKDEDEEASD